MERLAADGPPEVIGDAGVELAMVALDEFDGLLEGACAKEEEECSEKLERVLLVSRHAAATGWGGLPGEMAGPGPGRPGNRDRDG